MSKKEILVEFFYWMKLQPEQLLFDEVEDIVAKYLSIKAEKYREEQNEKRQQRKWKAKKQNANIVQAVEKKP